ncbi:MAG TPA: hypothetical protein VMT16_15035 [Thermoanaerobaculia bacterium]|nr:hypothetical protein [Thermoanaerobaculia bacterium]
MAPPRRRPLHLAATLSALLGALLAAPACQRPDTSAGREPLAAPTPATRTAAPPEGGWQRETSGAWLVSTGAVEIEVPKAEARGFLEAMDGATTASRLRLEILVREPSTTVPTLAVVVEGLPASPEAGSSFALRSPGAGGGLVAYATAQSDRVGTLRDFTDRVSGRLTIDESSGERLAGRLELVAHEPIPEPPAEDAPAAPPGVGTAPRLDPTSVELRAAFRLARDAIKRRQPAEPALPLASAATP